MKEWKVIANDVDGEHELGLFETKQEAIDYMIEWTGSKCDIITETERVSMYGARVRVINEPELTADEKLVIDVVAYSWKTELAEIMQEKEKDEYSKYVLEDLDEERISKALQGLREKGLITS